MGKLRQTLTQLTKPKGSWRTTAAAIAVMAGTFITLVILPIYDGDPSTKAHWAEFFTALAGALGLYNARDDKVTSEQAGAKRPQEPKNENNDP